MLKLLLAASTVLLGHSAAQDANCDYSQQVTPGQTYYVYSPNYPSNYSAGIQCRWIATSPTGYNSRLYCSEINLPQTTGCSQDRLLVSKSGDPQLNAADSYCGRGTLTAVSTGQRISIGLISANTSPGGRFMCQLSAQVATTNNTCQCGYKKTNRIVGGVETGVNEYPSMAGIVDARIFTIKCGAVIIDKRYVLTAAHCLANQSVNNVAVVVGEHNVNTGSDTPATQAIRASRLIIHPLYSASTNDYDIAIVRLVNDIEFSDRVGPVCLPFKFTNIDLTGQYLTALGWGTEFFGGPVSDVLMKTDLKVISQTDCRSTTNYLTNRQICTYTPGKDACQDDSGGPLLYTDPATGLLFNIGIVSYGQSCASGTPGINTRVTQLLNWIQANTPTVTYCRK